MGQWVRPAWTPRSGQPRSTVQSREGAQCIEQTGLIASLAQLTGRYVYPFGPNFWLKRRRRSPPVDCDWRSSLCVANNGRTSFQCLLLSMEEFSLEEQASSWGSTSQLGNVALSPSGFLEAAPSSWEAKMSRTEHAGKISSTRQTPDLSWELRSIVRQSPGMSSFPTTTARKETIATGKQKTVEAQPLDQETGCPWGEKLKTHT